MFWLQDNETGIKSFLSAFVDKYCVCVCVSARSGVVRHDPRVDISHIRRN